GRRTEVVPLFRRLPSNTGCFLLLSDKFGSGRRSHHQHHQQPGAPSAARRANSQMDIFSINKRLWPTDTGIHNVLITAGASSAAERATARAGSGGRQQDLP
ncbi:hypothetical protein Nmel_014411, partial [Mimus melanotis]